MRADRISPRDGAQNILFLRQEQWIVREWQAQLKRRACPDRTRRMNELSQRAGHLKREYARFEKRVFGPSRSGRNRKTKR